MPKKNSQPQPLPPPAWDLPRVAIQLDRERHLLFGIKAFDRYFKLTGIDLLAGPPETKSDAEFEAWLVGPVRDPAKMLAEERGEKPATPARSPSGPSLRSLRAQSLNLAALCFAGLERRDGRQVDEPELSLENLQEMICPRNFRIIMPIIVQAIVQAMVFPEEIRPPEAEANAGD